VLAVSAWFALTDADTDAEKVSVMCFVLLVVVVWEGLHARGARRATADSAYSWCLIGREIVAYDGRGVRSTLESFRVNVLIRRQLRSKYGTK
jgi:hypothetical protein